MLAVVGLAAACGGGSGPSPELEAAQAEVVRLTAVEQQHAEAATTIDRLTDDVEALEASLTETEAALQAARADRDAAEAALAELDVELADVRSAFDGAEGAAADAAAEAARLLRENEELRLRYDAEIRAELEAEVAAEVDRACTAAIADIDAAVSTLVRWTTAWSPITDRTTVEEQVEACAAPERAKSAEEREAERLAACGSVEPDQVERNPRLYDGECVRMFAEIVQFDVNTGPCAFHARIAPEFSTRYSNYGARSTFGFQDDATLSALVRECPDLDGIDVDDYIEVWATGAGVYSYDTSLGGTNTVPVFRIEKVELVQKG